MGFPMRVAVDLGIGYPAKWGKRGHCAYEAVAQRGKEAPATKHINREAYVEAGLLPCWQERLIYDGVAH